MNPQEKLFDSPPNQPQARSFAFFIDFDYVGEVHATDVRDGFRKLQNNSYQKGGALVVETEHTLTVLDDHHRYATSYRMLPRTLFREARANLLGTHEKGKGTPSYEELKERADAGRIEREARIQKEAGRDLPAIPHIPAGGDMLAASGPARESLGGK